MAGRPNLTNLNLAALNDIGLDVDIPLVDAAKKLGTHRNTLYYWRDRGWLKTYAHKSLTNGRWLREATRGEKVEA